MNNPSPTPVQHAPYLLPLQAAAYGLNGFNTGGLVSLGGHHQLGAGVMGAGQLGKLAGLPQGMQGAYPGLTAVSLANNVGQLHGLQVASAMGQLPAGVMSQLAAGQLPPLSGLGPHQPGSLYSPMMSPGALGAYTGVPGSHALPQVLGPNGMTNMPKLFVPSVKVGVRNTLSSSRQTSVKCYFSPLRLSHNFCLTVSRSVFCMTNCYCS